MEATTNSKKNKRKFKQTKQLVRLALNEGWSQVEIAEKCRTQQSVVSAWNKGTKQGTEQQLKPLLEVFGYKLRRNSFRAYWSVSPKTKEKTYYKVEGKVIFSQAFCFTRVPSHKKYKQLPMQRLVIHHQGQSKFRVILQSRFELPTDHELEPTIEDSFWNSEITKQFDLPELLRFIEQYSEGNLRDYPCDANTLSFIARQALLNHGFDIDGIVEYPAIW